MLLPAAIIYYRYERRELTMRKLFLHVLYYPLKCPIKNREVIYFLPKRIATEALGSVAKK